MGLTVKTIKKYRFVCDRCGAAAPTGWSKDASLARAAAAAAGFGEKMGSEPDYVSAQFLCAECLKDPAPG